MTTLALDRSESYDPTAACTSTTVTTHDESPTSVKGRAHALPTLSLRKRAVSGDRDSPNPLPTVNSAFLSGLFADVAEIEAESSTEPSHEEDDNVVAPSFEEHFLEPSTMNARPLKKSRLSLSRSISRCGRSFMNLNVLQSPTAATEIFEFTSQSSAAKTMKTSLCREDSLAFQLQCVSSCDSNATQDATSASTKVTTGLVGDLVFPHLPATISNSSCNTLTRNLSDLQTSLSETEDKECYGWFVEMEDGVPTVRDAADPYYPKMSDLAFKAPTAPNAINHDEEVEWAKAADTVDDVLGDFF